MAKVGGLGKGDRFVLRVNKESGEWRKAGALGCCRWGMLGNGGERLARACVPPDAANAYYLREAKFNPMN